MLLEKRANGVSFYEMALNDSKSADSYRFISLRATLGALNAVIAESNDTNIINLQKKLVDNIVNSAEVSSSISNSKGFHDEFKGWISRTQNKAFEHEVPLYESYVSVYIAQFLYLIKEMEWRTLSLENDLWYLKTVAFLEHHIWKKWYTRATRVYQSPNRYFLRSRLHMGANWAGFALFLEKMTNNPVVEKQCHKLYTDFDLLLKRNLRTYSSNSWIWNSNYEVVVGTGAIRTVPAEIQDVSHGNHVISYVVEAFEIGNENWELNHLEKFCNTLKYKIYNPVDQAFSDNVDGTSNRSRPGWGNFVADGWIKLTKYDKQVSEIFEEFLSSRLAKKYNQELQLMFNYFRFGERQ